VFRLTPDGLSIMALGVKGKMGDRLNNNSVFSVGSVRDSFLLGLSHACPELVEASACVCGQLRLFPYAL
jgi:hypothetical protein